MKNENNIFPVFDELLQREHKEMLLNQRSKVIWFTGLSGSGKTTLARELEKQLYGKGFLTQVLDGDNIRSGINNNLGFTDDDRTENIRRIAEVSKLLINSGVITINSFISPTDKIRKMAIGIIGEDDFIEIFLSTPLYVCEERDVKGLYKKARLGLIKNFTGIDAPFETPVDPDIEIDTTSISIEDCVEIIIDKILPKITF